MNRDELKQCILDAIGDIAPEAEFDTLDPDDGLREQLDLDSMDFLNVVIALHETLGVDIPEADYRELFTLNGAVAYLERKLQPAATGASDAG
jgi:acyl carrier protein